jgi:hypothetical protein
MGSRTHAREIAVSRGLTALTRRRTRVPSEKRTAGGQHHGGRKQGAGLKRTPPRALLRRFSGDFIRASSRDSSRSTAVSYHACLRVLEIKWRE